MNWNDVREQITTDEYFFKLYRKNYSYDATYNYYYYGGISAYILNAKNCYLNLCLGYSGRNIVAFLVLSSENYEDLKNAAFSTFRENHTASTNENISKSDVKSWYNRNVGSVNKNVTLSSIYEISNENGDSLYIRYYRVDITNSNIQWDFFTELPKFDSDRRISPNTYDNLENDINAMLNCISDCLLGGYVDNSIVINNTRYYINALKIRGKYNFNTDHTYSAYGGWLLDSNGNENLYIVYLYNTDKKTFSTFAMCEEDKVTDCQFYTCNFNDIFTQEFCVNMLLSYTDNTELQNKLSLLVSNEDSESYYEMLTNTYSLTNYPFIVETELDGNETYLIDYSSQVTKKQVELTEQKTITINDNNYVMLSPVYEIFTRNDAFYNTEIEYDVFLKSKRYMILAVNNDEYENIISNDENFVVDDDNINPEIDDTGNIKKKLDDLKTDEMGLDDITMQIQTRFTHMYHTNNLELYKLSNFLWNMDDSTFDKITANLKLHGENPLDAIISIMQFPLDLSKYCNTEDYNIIIGRNDTGIKSNTILTYKPVINIGNISVKPMFNDFRDYGNYTNIYIYLPYYGIKELNTDLLMGRILTVKLIIDIYTGVGMYVLLADDIFLDVINCQIARTDVITGTNQSAIASSMQSSLVNGIKHIARYIGTATGMISKVSSEEGINASDASNSINGMIDNVTGLGMDIIQGTTSVGKGGFESVGNFASACNMSSNQNVYLIYEYGNYHFPANYDIVYGYPLNESFKFKDIKGMIVVDNPKIEGLTATTEELKEIYNLLSNGVYYD